MAKNMAAAAILGAALAVSGLSAAHAQTVPLKIGAIGPLSGGGTAWGLALQRGVEMAIDEAKKNGGLKIGGKTYMPELVMYDDGYTSAGGYTAAQRLTTLDKVRFVIGSLGSPAVIGEISVTNPAKVLALTDGYAETILKNKDHAPYNFRVMDTEVEFGPIMIKWLHEHYPNIKKVALIAPNDATGQSVIPSLAASYKANGIDVWQSMFDRGSQEFTPLITKMMAQGVDLIDLNSNAPGDAGLILKQARQAGYKGMIWQVGGPSVKQIAEVAGPLADGFVSLDVSDSTSADGKAFEDAYHAKWSGIMNSEVPVWYNAAQILFAALEHAGTVSDVDKVRTALTGLDGYKTPLYGAVQWGGQAAYGVNHQLMLPFWIVQVKNGQEVPITMIRPDAH